ncbi:MAG: chemotaxis protein CheB [Paracoccaceae bacterium]
MTTPDARTAVPDFPLVALGASAGGIGALQAFFAAAPADAGVAWVVVQHLSPDIQSHLAEILGRATAMPVVEVDEDTIVARDTVYVIVPDEALVLDGARLCIRAAGDRPRHPVDRLFESVADQLGPRAIGVVLSGTGSNGSAGARAIKAADGAVFVQEPGEASHAGMPRATIAAGAADAVLPAAELPAAALAYAEHAPASTPETPDETVRRQLEEIVALLRSRLRRDFSEYKQGTLYRRVSRRMGLAGLDDLAAYRAKLREDRDELAALARDLLVNVTAFFRDEEAWGALERAVVRPMVAEAEPGGDIRAWTPGCATGEEAYSLAMLFLEAAEDAGREISLKVFATDPAEEALERARTGTFAGAVAEAMPPERLRRFFDRDGEGYVAKPHLRESIVVAPQNLLSDPPFSRLDVACCRNLLIYLKPEAQERVLATLHFALGEGGFLFLGAAESAGERSALFEPVMARHRIYRRTGASRHGVRLPPEQALPPRPQRPAGRTEPARAPGVAERTRAALVEAFAPPSVLVDHRLQTLYFEGDVSLWLAQPPGEPTQDLVRLVRPGLAARLRAAADQALKTGRPARFDARPTARADAAAVTVHVRPLAAAGEDATRLLVSFVAGAPAEAAPGSAAPPVDEGALEEALRHSREELRQTIAQLESSNEALQASNEEISSINEEYQAANEELETSKEELQSLNEELNTVNAQLQNKVAELERRTNDLDNLLSSTDVATLFLDRELRIRWFTPHMRQLFSLEDTDRGRPVTDFAMHFEDEAFVADARAVFDDLRPREGEVHGAGGRWFLRRALPYRASGDRLGGVVVTFVDITERREAEQRVRESEARFRALVETSAAMVWTTDPEGRVSEDSPSWRAFTGQTSEQWLGEGWTAAVHPADRDRAAREWREAVAGGATFEAEFRVWHAPSGEWRDTVVRAAPIREGNGAIRERVGMNIDVTEQRRADRRTRVLLDELQHRVKNLFANIHALHRLSYRSGGELGTVARRFEERLVALERTQDLLAARSDERVDLRALVAAEVEALDGADRVRLTGEALALERATAQGLGLIVHELVTNARKHGALAVEGGRVEVSWARVGVDAPRLVFYWKELGVEIDGPPSHGGFGSELIRKAGPYMTGGEGELRFEPDGVRYTLDAPLGEDAGEATG